LEVATIIDVLFRTVDERVITGGVQLRSDLTMGKEEIFQLRTNPLWGTPE
jgi:hypothetical protein